VGTTANNVINLDTFSISIGPSNPLQQLAFVNIGDFDFTTHVRTSKHPTHGTTTTPKSIGIKMKISSIFMSIIEANDKKNKTLVGTMDHINAS
jgi:predicted component of type VI protein secretion system